MVETAALVYDESGAVAATLETERTAMDLTDADYEQLLRGGLPYQRTVTLKPGRYQVRLAAREDATGLLGSAWQRVEVPDLATGRLALSSLFLLKDEAADAAAGAGRRSRPAQRPGAAALRRAESLYVQLYAYNPKRDASGAIDLDGAGGGPAGRRAARDGGAGADGGGRAPGPVPHVSRIRLQRFEPGDYELRVTVTDRNASAMVARTVGVHGRLRMDVETVATFSSRGLDERGRLPDVLRGGADLDGVGARLRHPRRTRPRRTRRGRGRSG